MITFRNMPVSAASGTYSDLSGPIRPIPPLQSNLLKPNQANQPPKNFGLIRPKPAFSCFLRAQGPCHDAARPMDDCIFISGLELHSHIGVPATERAAPQRLTVSLRLTPTRNLSGLNDDISNTIDYAAVSQAVREEAATKPRRLIETLAEDIATLLLGRFPLKSVEIDLRKYVLDGAEYTAIRIRRER